MHAPNGGKEVPCFHDVFSCRYLMRDKIAGSAEFLSEFRRRSLFTRSGPVCCRHG